jgi:hypothetical protein
LSFNVGINVKATFSNVNLLNDTWKSWGCFRLLFFIKSFIENLAL